MRGAGEGNFTPSQRRRPLGAMVEGKEILNSTLTTYEATERLRLDDDNLPLFTTGSVLGGGGGGPPPALLAVPPTIPSAPINSHELPLYSPSPTPSAPQQPCLTPSISPTLPPPCTPCGTFAFLTSSATRGPPSPASTLPMWAVPTV